MVLPIAIATVCYFKRGQDAGREVFLVDYTDTTHPIHAGLWSPPGGHFDTRMGDRDNGDCIVRESFEEQVMAADKKDLIYRGRVLFKNDGRTFNGKPAKKSFIVHYFDCHKFDDSRAEAKEGRQFWIREGEMPGNPKIREADHIVWDWLGKYKEIDAIITHDEERVRYARLLKGTPF